MGAVSEGADALFDVAFAKLTASVSEMPWCLDGALQRSCMLSFQDAMAHFLYYAHPGDYAWSIARTLHHLRRANNCPALNGAVHVPYFGLPFRAESGSRNHTLSWVLAWHPRYLRFANFFIRLGICAAHKVAHPRAEVPGDCKPPFRLPTDLPEKGAVAGKTKLGRWHVLWIQEIMKLEYDVVNLFLLLLGCSDTVCHGIPAAVGGEGFNVHRWGARRALADEQSWDLICGDRSLAAMQSATLRSLRALNLSAAAADAKLTALARPWHTIEV
eukprot:TRINITY_DN125571_c0_g1_i1.p1 TRINITY_DN125571_c0_g1~~TRINITY_DN125571_c0_g1_i1.p1  ORF type:complete len:272 (+),score=46.28 TRINITY_DN125571_c0_g1_i1:86-901(+)